MFFWELDPEMQADILEYYTRHREDVVPNMLAVTVLALAIHTARGRYEN